MIQSPGKFEGEMVYVPYYWNLMLDGAADSDDGTMATFVIDKFDVIRWPELGDVTALSLSESNDGFVYAETN